MYYHIAHFMLMTAGVLGDPYQFPMDLSTWIEVEIPKPGTEAYDRLIRADRNSKHDWLVSTDGQKMTATRRVERYHGPKPDFPLELEDDQFARYRQRANTAIRVEDGWLVSYNMGEFGGTVWWFAPDGKRRYKVLDYTNVNQFIRTKDGVFAIEGLSHLTRSIGSVSRFAVKKGLWVPEVLAKLPSDGRAGVVAPDGSLIVMTDPMPVNEGKTLEIRARLVRVTMAGKVETISDFPGYFFIRMTSMQIAPSGTFYFGSRHFVGMFNPKDKAPALKLLVPNKHFLPPAK